MNKRRVYILSILMAALFSALSEGESRAQTAVGTFHSPKGFGLSLETSKGPDYDHFASFFIIADMMDVWNDKRASVGTKATYTHNIVIRRGVLDKTVDWEFYAGPGLTGGLARDTGKDYGLIAGITGCTGARLSFSNKVMISLDLNLDICAFATRNSRKGNYNMAFYEAGLTHFPYPQIKISYALR